MRLVNASGGPYDGTICTHHESNATVGRASVANAGESVVGIPGQVVGIGRDLGA